jgi:LuxR family transcriptional regulator, maltose regulon positive regulatory protein
VNTAGDSDQDACAAHRCLADSQLLRGRLREAAETLRQALRFSAEKDIHAVPGTGVAHMKLGEVLREWNDLEAAKSHLLEGTEVIERA